MYLNGLSKKRTVVFQAGLIAIYAVPGIVMAGTLEKMLTARKIHYNESIKLDPYSFLPDWLHPR